jgi:hypothetical protein
MKKIFTCLVLLAVVLQSCVVKSLHPFFTSADVIFKTELLNTWTDEDGNKWTIQRSKTSDKTYEMRYEPEGQSAVVFEGHLFELNSELYFDFVPEDIGSTSNSLMLALHLLPVHSVAKVKTITKNKVEIKWFNEKWIKSLFEQNKIKIKHEELQNGSSRDDKEYVLTASTAELQKFLIKYGVEDSAYDDDNTIWLKLKPAI